MKSKIWIIDDYLPMLDCLKIVLELHHYEVEITRDDLSLLNNHSIPDLLLIDYHIPGIEGDTIFQKIKNNSTLKKIPTLLMSGHQNIEQLAILCGANDFIAKPFDFNELLIKIARLCSENNHESTLF